MSMKNCNDTIGNRTRDLPRGGRGLKGKYELPVVSVLILPSSVPFTLSRKTPLHGVSYINITIFFVFVGWL